MAGETLYSNKFKVMDCTIDMDEMLKYAEKALGELKSKAPMAVRTAINKAAKNAKKLDEKTAKSTYTDKDKLNSLNLTKATTSNLTAILRDKGENVSMLHFKYRVGKRQTSVLINKKHGYKSLFAGAERKPFIASGTLNNDGSGMMVRVAGKYITGGSRKNRKHTKHTEALEKLHSISSPVQHGNPKVWDIEVMPITEKDIYKELDKQITNIWNKHIGA